MRLVTHTYIGGAKNGKREDLQYFGKVAQEEGVSLAEVVFEIELAISVAYQNAKHSNDKTMIKVWDEIPCDGDIPTAVELINYISNRVVENNLH